MGKQDMVAWQPADDLKILELHKTMGPRWSTIASRFPGRTVSSIRNRFLRVSAGEKLRDAGQITKNRCQLCGLPKRGHICQVKLAAAVQHVVQQAPAAQQVSTAPVAVVPAEQLIDFSRGQEPKQTTQAQDDVHADLPVAAASVTITQPLITPPQPLPPHMLIERQTVGLPTSSPLLLMRPAFTFSSAHAFEPEDVVEDECEEDAEAEAEGMMNQENDHELAAPSAIPPRMLMVDIGNSTDDERDQPSTPAAA